MSLSTISHAFTRGEITDENGVNYTIKRLTNRSPAANTEANKQLRVEVVSLLITYIQREYFRVSIDEIHFQIGSYRLYGHAPCGKDIVNCMPGCTDYSAITAIDSMDNNPLLLFVKGSVNVQVYVDNFRMNTEWLQGKEMHFLHG